MRKLLLVVGTGLLVAAAVAPVVLLRLQQETDSLGDSDLLTVIVSTKDIPALQALDPLIAKGVFVEIRVPHDLLVEGAVTDIRQMVHTTATTVILKNEQIPEARLRWTDPNAGSSL